MFKILKTFQTNKFLTNNVTRQFAHYCDAGEHHFLDKLNYIGNRDIYWTHPQSSIIIRVTDDYDRCLQGNQSTDDNTCWWYFPKRIRTVMENDFSERDACELESEIRNWKLFENASEHSIDWYAKAGSRCVAWFSQRSAEQKIFAARQFASTFYTDDAIEKLISNRQYNSTADEFLYNLWLVFSGKGSEVTDMRKFKGQDNILDSYIERAIETIEIQKELVRTAKQVLKPKIYDSFILACYHYLSGVTAEKPLFQEHCTSKTIIKEQEGRFARDRSIGMVWVLSTLMTDEATAIHLNQQNPAVDFATHLTTLGNDIIGYFKDKYVDFSPLTYFNTSASGQSDLCTARMLANRANEIQRVLMYIWDNVPTENAKHYEHLAKYVGFLTDYNFAIGRRHANFRYGWIPRMD